MEKENENGNDKLKEQTARRMVVELAAAFPEVHLRAETITAYTEHLREFSAEDLKYAKDRAMKSWERTRDFPTIAFLRGIIAERYKDMQERQLAKRTQEILERGVHPDWQGKTEDQRRREFQQIILESWASGVWGPERQVEAIPMLEAFKRGETVAVPWQLDELVKQSQHKKGEAQK